MMDSREILRQYVMGAIKSSGAISELEKLLVDTSTLSKLQEAARARYVIGFIHRDGQFARGQISGKDICLNIRDLVLVLGCVKLTKKLYQVVNEFGSEFDLICEMDFQVSCTLNIPAWITPGDYVRDVYALKPGDNVDLGSSSAGDAMLLQYTSFSTYKNFEQKLAVHSALNLPHGDTLLISLPTGGGKSLVTQLLASVSAGLTVVIVPTVALALDQYYAAKNNLRRNEDIFFYRGEQSDAERTAMIQAIREKSARLLFTSPEAILKNQKIYELLDIAAEEQYLTNIVIDEAHIVPDWGVFFRPDFQIFSIVLKKWRRKSENQIRTYLLSATLSDDVVDTLFSLFGTEGHHAQVRCDALRQEPRFYFQSVKSLQERDEKMMEAIRLLPKPMVVYVLEPREAKDLQKKLRQIDYLNIPIFTGETKENERDIVLSGWKNHEYDIVIATSAFGIGVDKPDVRTIIHVCCPENLGRFYQEVGRGGRDGLPSLSLFMPYQSQHDGKGDVRRALGLVNKRVLTVERSVIRWNSMISNPVAIVDADECVLDTSVIPPTMNDEKAEYAGNRNVAWNINLLLFLHRTGFISLLDANFVQNRNVYPQKKYYTVTIKMLKPDVLADNERLAEALTEPRKREYESQMVGYRIMSALAASPKKKCWGQVFRHLFPLSREVCNGCPAHPEGRVTTDDTYKLRVNPDISMLPAKLNKKFRRNIGSFHQLIVKRVHSGPCTLDEATTVTEKSNENEIGAIVAPKRFMGKLIASGILLDYEEFYFAVEHCPYLFAKGVTCIFDDNMPVNYTLYKNLERLEDFGYKRVLYCNENAVITSSGKSLRESIEGYAIPFEKF